MQNNIFTRGRGTTDADFILQYIKDDVDYRTHIAADYRYVGDGKAHFIVAYFWGIGQNSISYEGMPHQLERVFNDADAVRGCEVNGAITLGMTDQKTLRNQFAASKRPTNKGLVIGTHGQAKLLEDFELHCIEVVGNISALKKNIHDNAPKEYRRIQKIINRREAKSQANGQKARAHLPGGANSSAVTQPVVAQP